MASEKKDEKLIDTDDASPEVQAQMQQIIQTYKAMRAEIQNLAAKIAELDGERNEHSLVLKTISTLDPGRRCYRSIGGVLVERTVKEVLPAVQQNLTKLDGVVGTLTDKLKQKEKECDEFRAKYNIRPADETGAVEEGDHKEKDESKAKGTSILA